MVTLCRGNYPQIFSRQGRSDQLGNVESLSEVIGQGPGQVGRLVSVESCVVSPLPLSSLAMNYYGD